MLTGFIFDVEGTLVDSVPQNLRSLQDALERRGYRVSYQTLQLYSGLDGDQALQLMLPEIAGMIVAWLYLPDGNPRPTA